MHISRSACGRIVCAPLAAAILWTGCTSGAKKGAAIGGALGAATGAVIGHQGGRTAGGAVTGVVVGAATGAIIGDYMEKQKQDLQKVPGADVKREGDRLIVTFNEAILFDFNSYQLKEASQKNLIQMADVLVNYPDTDLEVEGHTDNVGSEAYNLRLSEQRADAVKTFLAAHRVDSSRLASKGYGETQPVTTNETDSGRAQNRRVQLQIAANEALQKRATEQSESK